MSGKALMMGWLLAGAGVALAQGKGAPTPGVDRSGGRIEGRGESAPRGGQGGEEAMDRGQLGLQRSQALEAIRVRLDELQAAAGREPFDSLAVERARRALADQVREFLQPPGGPGDAAGGGLIEAGSGTLQPDEPRADPPPRGGDPIPPPAVLLHQHQELRNLNPPRMVGPGPAPVAPEARPEDPAEGWAVDRMRLAERLLAEMESILREDRAADRPAEVRTLLESLKLAVRRVEQMAPGR